MTLSSEGSPLLSSKQYFSPDKVGMVLAPAAPMTMGLQWKVLQSQYLLHFLFGVVNSEEEVRRPAPIFLVVLLGDGNRGLVLPTLAGYIHTGGFAM